MKDNQDDTVNPQLTAIAASEKIKGRSNGMGGRALEERQKIREKISKAREAELKDRAKLVEKIMDLDLRFRELASERKSLEEECGKLRGLLRDARASDVKVSSLKGDLEDLEGKLDKSEEARREAQQETEKVKEKVQDLTKEIDRLKSEAYKDQDELAEARKDRDEWKEAFLEVQEALNELFNDTDKADSSEDK
jgi:chromosome segregation ATPase